MSCVATVRVRVQERKSSTNTFTVGSCQCGKSRMRTGDDGKDLCLLGSCDRNWWQECYY